MMQEMIKGLKQMKQDRAIGISRLMDSDLGRGVQSGFNAGRKQLLSGANTRIFVSVFLFVWALTSVITLISYEPAFVSKSMVIIKDTALTAKYVTNDSYETTTSQSTSSVINTMGLLKAEAYKRSLFQFFQEQHPAELDRLKIKNYEEWDAFYGDGSDFISYSNAPGTDLINLEFKWSDPVIAQAALGVVVDTFKGLSLNLNQSEQRERSEYLTGQIADIQNKLTLVRYKISQVKEKNQIIDLAEENANLARVRLNLKTDLKTASAEARGRAQQLAGYQQLLGMSARQAVRASAVGRNELLSKQYSELYALRSERNSLLTRYTESSVKVMDIDNRIAQLEENIDKELRRTTGQGIGKREPVAIADSTRSDAIGRMMSAKADAMDLGTKSRVLQQYLNELDGRARKLNKVSVALSDYRLEESSLDESLKQLKEKELDAKLKQSQMLSNVFVVEEADLPLKAAFPRKVHLLLVDFFLGLACAGAALFLKKNLMKRRPEEALASSYTGKSSMPIAPNDVANAGANEMPAYDPDARLFFKKAAATPPVPRPSHNGVRTPETRGI